MFSVVSLAVDLVLVIIGIVSQPRLLRGGVSQVLDLTKNLVIHLVLEVGLVLLVSGKDMDSFLGLHLFLVLDLLSNSLGNPQIVHLLLNLLQIVEMHLPVQYLRLLQMPLPAQQRTLHSLRLLQRCLTSMQRALHHPHLLLVNYPRICLHQLLYHRRLLPQRLNILLIPLLLIRILHHPVINPVLPHPPVHSLCRRLRLGSLSLPLSLGGLELDGEGGEVVVLGGEVGGEGFEARGLLAVAEGLFDGVDVEGVVETVLEVFLAAEVGEVGVLGVYLLVIHSLHIPPHLLLLLGPLQLDIQTLPNLLIPHVTHRPQTPRLHIPRLRLRPQHILIRPVPLKHFQVVLHR